MTQHSERPPRSIEDAIEASSLGTPEAKAFRDGVDPELAAEIAKDSKMSVANIKRKYSNRRALRKANLAQSEGVPKTFYLHRHEDVSGISGTGIIADGVVWPDGKVSVRWRGDKPSTVFWESIEDVIEIHGHNGATSIHFY